MSLAHIESALGLRASSARGQPKSALRGPSGCRLGDDACKAPRAFAAPSVYPPLLTNTTLHMNWMRSNTEPHPRVRNPGSTSVKKPKTTVFEAVFLELIS